MEIKIKNVLKYLFIVLKNLNVIYIILILIKKKGNQYTGEFLDNLRHGYGEMKWIDGSVYKG